MSVQATSWVWARSNAKESTLLVALAIADGANKEGSESCQSVRTLGSMARCSESTVHRALKWLVEAGEIECIGTNPRYRHTNIYRFVAMWNPAWDAPSRGATGDTSQNDTPVTGAGEGVSSEAERGAAGGTQPQEATPGRTTPSPSGDDGGSGVPAPSPSGEALSSDDELFEDFWHHYPKKVSRKDARTAFGKALKATDYLTLQTGLVSAIKAWKVDGKVVIEGSGEALKVKVASGEAGKGVPHAATWLNGERWNDEYPDARSATGQSGEDPNAWMHRTE